MEREKKDRKDDREIDLREKNDERDHEKSEVGHRKHREYKRRGGILERDLVRLWSLLAIP